MPTRIDWCDETINPLGHWCFGPGGTRKKTKLCAWCYAAAMAKRGLNGCERCKTFSTPHTHFEQLEKLAKWKKPRTVFVQSMGDLFHDEVPDGWIHTVLDAAKAAPQHRYLFLTQNPERYSSLIRKGRIHDKKVHPNWWFGTTATAPGSTFFFGERYNTFLSMEPLVQALPQRTPKVNWVIVGAESGNRAEKVIPQREWVEGIVGGCKEAGIPIFLKSNLAGIWGEPLIQEYPWEVK